MKLEFQVESVQTVVTFFPLFLLFSTRYQIEDVAKACCDFLVKHLEPANVIGIARFAEEIGCTELHQKSREYINTHFNEVRSNIENTSAHAHARIQMCFPGKF